jgi:hypothetical protein
VKFVRYRLSVHLSFLSSLLPLIGLLAALAWLSGCAGLPALPTATPTPTRPANAPIPPVAYFATATPTPRPSPTPRVTPTPIPLDGPVTVAVAPAVADRYAAPVRAILKQATELQALNGPQPMSVVEDPLAAGNLIAMAPLRNAAHPLLERTFAAVAPFATLEDEIAAEEIQSRWVGAGGGPLFVTPESAIFLPTVLGERAVSVPVVSPGEMRTRLEATPGAVGLLGFDQLDPTFKALSVDGLNVLDKELDLRSYPLAVALHIEGEAAPLLVQYLRPIVSSLSPVANNRDLDQMTSLIMTGVTAMSRGTAAAMERNGYLFPAMVISDTLAAADITHVSNEVPFLDDCRVNNSVNNLILCSHTNYWAALEVIGTDIVGLSGNHVNDFGRDGARRSLTWYRENEIPIYGSGMNVTEACEPLRWTHGGNTFAFVAALAFGPASAWATDELPGACYYYDRKETILDLVRELAAEVDVVAVELQYVETYNPWPTREQVVEFRELRDAGADIVTGVQSHVPQAAEPYGAQDPGGPGMITYGLGNLFFDQMWSWETRTELMARHTIYAGRLLNTEILTAVLEDYAQPRWTTDDERRALLESVFDAAPPR